ncbi:relaxase domain-containing protein [Streptomyces sp. NBC_01754]|uniref:relaxase domain-containing protein n=1 Tax=Streptomyces sp. NBC_01754 TaxID=2975930 RepID=UPI002DD8E0B2|nr:relaxase domain-containing protein [Streptomyces sp. NBC_01754]WSC94629.1 relaxase domain-containing protein [Streptomyces sp. NBC_01754]
MLTVRMLKVAEDEAERAAEPSVAPAAFVRAQDPPDLRAHTVWTGSAEALRALGLRRGDEARTGGLSAAIAGRHAESGARVRVAGEAYDLTFLAPASLSWVWSQGDSALRVDLERAVLDAAHRCVDHLVRTRPLADGVEPGRGHAAALALHVVGTPRPWTQPPPPLLHVHTYLVGVLDGCGALRGPHQGELDEESLTREGGAVGRAALADDLRALGFTIRPGTGTGHGARGFEVMGVPERLLRAGQPADQGCAGLGEETDRDPWGDGFRR